MGGGAEERLVETCVEGDDMWEGEGADASTASGSSEGTRVVNGLVEGRADEVAVGQERVRGRGREGALVLHGVAGRGSMGVSMRIVWVVGEERDEGVVGQVAGC
jgi:hypothetical protein